MKVVLPLVDDRASSVRSGVIRILVGLLIDKGLSSENRKALKAVLVPALQDTDREARGGAADGLLHIGSIADIEPLENALANTTSAIEHERIENAIREIKARCE